MTDDLLDFLYRRAESSLKQYAGEEAALAFTLEEMRFIVRTRKLTNTFTWAELDDPDPVELARRLYLAGFQRFPESQVLERLEGLRGAGEEELRAWRRVYLQNFCGSREARVKHFRLVHNPMDRLNAVHRLAPTGGKK